MTLPRSEVLARARPAGGLTSLERVRHGLAGRVRAVLHDQASSQAPVQRRSDGLFGPGSVAWKVHGDVVTMMVGGVASLFLQMLHPAVLAGVWDHSNFRHDMHGRLRRTARFVAVTTYASRAEAEAAISTVRAIHARVQGTLPDGQRYSAQDPDLLTWVHVTETVSFLNAWIRYAEPLMPRQEQDRYFEEVAVVAEGLGARNVPRTRAEVEAYIDGMRPHLRVDQRTRQTAQTVLRQPGPPGHALPLELVRRAALDLLPGWARQMQGLRGPGVSAPLVAAATAAMAHAIRWALR